MAQPTNKFLHTTTLKLERPCPADIADLGPDERHRHCTLCDTAVHNLSAMTEQEARAFIDTNAEMCVSYETDENDTVQFQPARPSRRMPALMSLMSAIGLSMTTQVGCDVLDDKAANDNRGLKDKLADQMKGLFIDDSRIRKVPKTRKFRGKIKVKHPSKRSKRVQARLQKAAEEAAQKAAQTGALASAEANTDICYEVEVPDTGE